MRDIKQILGSVYIIISELIRVKEEVYCTYTKAITSHNNIKTSHFLSRIAKWCSIVSITGNR